ncbi:hypothetical protein Mapa_005816 [Marchantia paleacea]|nr:hypothetical protein Mapa_005816 [Marchantia paleacea]
MARSTCGIEFLVGRRIGELQMYQLAVFFQALSAVLQSAHANSAHHIVELSGQSCAVGNFHFVLESIVLTDHGGISAACSEKAHM